MDRTWSRTDRTFGQTCFRPFSRWWVTKEKHFFPVKAMPFFYAEAISFPKVLLSSRKKFSLIAHENLAGASASQICVEVIC